MLLMLFISWRNAIVGFWCVWLHFCVHRIHFTVCRLYTSPFGSTILKPSLHLKLYQINTLLLALCQAPLPPNSSIKTTMAYLSIAQFQLKGQFFSIDRWKIFVTVELLFQILWLLRCKPDLTSLPFEYTARKNVAAEWLRIIRHKIIGRR